MRSSGPRRRDESDDGDSSGGVSGEPIAVQLNSQISSPWASGIPSRTSRIVTNVTSRTRKKEQKERNQVKTSGTLKAAVPGLKHYVRYCQICAGIALLLVPFEQNNVDRRIAARFPIERDIHYKLLIHNGGNEEGTGKSINISSGGILFTTDCHLQPGTGLEVTVSWPVLLDSEVRLRLVVLGRVVCSRGGNGAVVIS